MTHSSPLAGTSFFGLFRDLKAEVKTLVQQELTLARTEIAEKISSYSRNAILLVVGGLIAYAGLVVFLGGLGLLLAFAFEKAGLSPTLARFVGLAAIGLVIVAIGAVLILKGVKTLSRLSFTPERTLVTIKHFRGADRPEAERPAIKEETPKRSSEELEREVLATEGRIGRTLEAIADRASPVRIKNRVLKQIQTHPYKWSLYSLGGGLLSSVFLRRKLFGKRA